MVVLNYQLRLATTRQIAVEATGMSVICNMGVIPTPRMGTNGMES
ncbi:hypothetical protein TBK1r_42770 [Stieleria magnilauensis]|uniref:Uncharacterized protein n=1 Tax=Stieleria magnilauensis TaxID=2527963 RepID=A0ABX5XTG1_9BACT|nr:hypothetical protein TBK1r_42770 [Planctomycetes bacterium TBK1r]